MSSKIRVGVLGSAGYTGGELLRLLVNHPQVDIVFAHSHSQAGKKWYHTHADLLGDTEAVFDAELRDDVDAIFLCVGHGEAKKWLDSHTFPASVRLIDLSQDFRWQPGPRAFVYGLPELQREAIRTAQNIANPGCFATAIQLALLPLAQAGLLREAVHINATTGSTGAGQSLSETSHFSWRQNNLSVYKAFEHQHLREIRHSLLQLQPDLAQPLHFIPQRGAFTRGILAAVYTTFDGSQADAAELYRHFYADHPFTHLSPANIDLKQVVNTNKCFLHLEKHGDQLMILSAIDNLLKGASGQAVQNFNLMFGLEETMGLRLKAIGF